MKESSPGDGIDIKALFFKLLDKWYFFVISLIICICVAYIKNRTSQRIYMVNATLKMNVGSSGAGEILDAVGLEEKNVNIEDEIIVMKSTDFIRETLNQLDFGISYFSHGDLVSKERYKKSFPISVKIDSSSNQLAGIPIYVNILSDQEYELKIKGENLKVYHFDQDRVLNLVVPKLDFQQKYRFGEAVKGENFGFTISLTGDKQMYGKDELYFTINTPQSLTRQYMGKLNIETAGRKSNILQLASTGNIVQKEVAFLNTLMQVVKQNDLNKKNQEGIKTIDFIDFQLTNISDSLNKAEKDLESFQYTTTSIGESSTLFAKRDQLDSQLAALNVKLSYFRNILSNLESLEGVSNVSAPATVGIDDPLLSNSLIKLSELNQQRIQLGRTATDANPVIQRIDLEIKTTKDALRDNLNGAINTTNITIDDLNNRMVATNSTINRLPSTERRKLGIERKFEFTDNTYDFLLQRKAAAGIALATSVSDWEIIEMAHRSRAWPVSPNTKFIYFLALILGLGIPTAIVLALDFFNNTVRSKEELEKITNIPILGSITRGRKYVKIATTEDHRSPLMESIRTIKVNLQYLSADKEIRVIGVTSSTSGEGKTFCSVNLSAAIAQSGKRVLLLDMDLRKSGLASYFDFKDTNGLSSYLIGKADLSKIVKPSPVKNLDVILSGPFPPNPFDLLATQKTKDLIHELKRRYDYVIIDSSPIGLVSDYLLILKSVDASIYVARYNYTNKNHLGTINDLYEKKKIPNLSLILNDVKLSSMYGYGYKSYHGYYGDKNQSNGDNGSTIKPKKVNIRQKVKNRVTS